MGLIWAGLGSAAIGAAGSIGSSLINSRGGGGGGGGGGGFSGKPPKFRPISFVPIENTELATGPTYNPNQGAIDFNALLPYLQQSAQYMTDSRTGLREQIMPGSQQQFDQASNVLNSWLRGEVPKDVVDFTNRQVAERMGGTYNPFQGGGKGMQQLQGDFARSIGRLSSDFTQLGISSAPAWQQLANSFVTGIDQTAQLANQQAAQRYQYDVLGADISKFNASALNSTNQFNAQGQNATNQFNAQGQWAGQSAAYQAAQDSYLSNQMQNNYNTSSLMSGLLGGAQAGLSAYGAYNSYANPSGMQISKPTGYRNTAGNWVNSGNYTLGA